MSARRRISSLATLTLAVVCCMLQLSTGAYGRVIKCVSVGYDGSESNESSQYPCISGDGTFVAFHSDASNLIPPIPGDTNNRKDVFLYDLWTDGIELVSVSTDGDQADYGSRNPSVNHDGAVVAFASDAMNFTSLGANGFSDVYVRDRAASPRETNIVSVSFTGGMSDGYSGNPSVSADGRFVAFYSEATNLVSGDTNGTADVFVRDLETGTTERVSLSGDGVQGNGASLYPSISPDGRFVAFHSYAANLVPNDTNEAADVFVHDRDTGETTRVSVATDGSQGELVINPGGAPESIYPSISSDGLYIAFQSDAETLVPGDTNTCGDVFLHDRLNGKTWRISVQSDGTQGTGHCLRPAISADGWRIAFEATGDVMFGDDTNLEDDIYVHDWATRETTTRVSITHDGSQADHQANRPSISADGNAVAFHSNSTNLVPGGSDLLSDIYVSMVEWDQRRDPAETPGLRIEAFTISDIELAEDGSVNVQIQATGATDARINILGLSRSLPPVELTHIGGNTWEGTIDGSVVNWAFGDRLTLQADVEDGSGQETWDNRSVTVIREPITIPDPEHPNDVVVVDSANWGTLKGERTILSDSPTLSAELRMKLVTYWLLGWETSLNVWPAVDKFTSGVSLQPAASGGVGALLAQLDRFGPVAATAYDAQFNEVGSYARFMAVEDTWFVLLPAWDFVASAVALETGLPSLSPGTILEFYGLFCEARPVRNALSRFSPPPENGFAWGAAAAYAAYDLSEIVTNPYDREFLRIVLEAMLREAMQDPSFVLGGFAWKNIVEKVIGPALTGWHIFDLVADHVAWAAVHLAHLGEGGPQIIFQAVRTPSGMPALAAQNSFIGLGNLRTEGAEMSFDVQPVGDGFEYEFDIANTAGAPLWEFRVELNPAAPLPVSILNPPDWEAEVVSTDWEHAVRWFTQGSAGWASGDYGGATIPEGESLSGFGFQTGTELDSCVFTVTDTDLLVDSGLVYMHPGLTVCPTEFAPANGETTGLQYHLDREGVVNLAIWDGGEIVKSLVDGAALAAGGYSTSWDGTDSGGLLVPPAEYEVRLEIAYAGTGGVTLSDTVAVIVPVVDPPVADFSGSPTSGDAPLTVEFTDLSTNSPTSWDWSFGDGSTSSEQNPSHTYTTASPYTVSLTAANAGGSHTETKADYIWGTENQDPILSNGGVSPSSGEASTTFSYTVDYYDQDGDAPSTKNVYIDGSPHGMTLLSGSAASGTYRSQTPLAAGSHEYYFYFTDGHGGSDRLPSSDTYSGPTVYVRMVIDLPVGIVQFSVPLLNPDDLNGCFSLGEIISDETAVVHHPGTGEVAWWPSSTQAYTYGTIDDPLWPGQAYFVETSSDCSLGFTGTPFALEVDIPNSDPAWHMIGAPSEACGWSECVHPPVDSGPWHWDTTLKQYVLASALEPGLGYWIHTTAAGSVTSPALDGLAAASFDTPVTQQSGLLPPADGPVLIDFDDVPEGHWAYSQIGEMRWRGVAAGSSLDPPVFGPTEPVTRDQMAVFLCRAYRLVGAEAVVPQFSDVAPDHWAYRYIEALADAGTVNGYRDGSYGPDIPVNRAQMAVFLARATGLSVEIVGEIPFADVSADHWAASAIAAVADVGISAGYPGDPPTYCPDATVTRDQMCVFLSRALSVPPQR